MSIPSYSRKGCPPCQSMLFSLYFLLPVVERVRSSSFSDVSAWLLPNKPTSGGRGKKRNQNQNRNLVLRKSMLTASDILEEGGDDVKSALPLWAGTHTCYNGNYNGKQGCKAERIWKDCLSSDCSLQLGNMKVESIVIADQHAAVNMYPGPVHTACHTLGIGFARSIGPMITHDFCDTLVPQRPLVVLLVHTTVGSSTGMKL
uniref:Uncharacterized protein n=1 Tax=Solanum lycopersicum TaxID=4081 RepID=K4BH93_SOLLC